MGGICIFRFLRINPLDPVQNCLYFTLTGYIYILYWILKLSRGIRKKFGQVILEDPIFLPDRLPDASKGLHRRLLL